MEKIYMNEMNKKNNKKTSTILSVALALIAVSAVALFAFNKVSYAAPNGVENIKPLPEKMKGVQGKTYATEQNKKWVIVYSTQLPDATVVPAYCLDANTAFGNGLNYSKDKEITDAGLLYILANSYREGTNYPFKDTENTIVAGKEKEVQQILSQMALWIYQHDKKIKVLQEVEYNDLVTALSLQEKDGNPEDTIKTGTKSIYERFGVKELVEKASKIHDKQVAANGDIALLQVTMGKGTPAKTTDDKYYQTDKITVKSVTFDEAFAVYTNKYSLGKNNLPEGFQLVYADGEYINKEIPKEKYNELPENFYIRIPVDKIKDGSDNNYQIEFVGNFLTYGGNEYKVVGQDAQVITTVMSKLITSPGKLGINITKVPDTASSITSTIYIVGVLVLILGVAIILVNTRPAKNEQ